MAEPGVSICPGCGLQMPRSDSAAYDGYFNTSPECWSVFTELLAAEFGNAVLFGQVHQLTVDTYAVQHAGDPHPDKSVGIHLAGLHLVFEQGMAPMKVPSLLQRLATAVDPWPHFPPPRERGTTTVYDVTLHAGGPDHVEAVREWAAGAWAAWRPHHADVAALVARHL